MTWKLVYGGAVVDTFDLSDEQREFFTNQIQAAMASPAGGWLHLASPDGNDELQLHVANGMAIGFANTTRPVFQVGGQPTGPSAPDPG